MLGTKFIKVRQDHYINVLYIFWCSRETKHIKGNLYYISRLKVWMQESQNPIQITLLENSFHLLLFHFVSTSFAFLRVSSVWNSRKNDFKIIFSTVCTRHILWILLSTRLRSLYSKKKGYCNIWTYCRISILFETLGLQNGIDKWT